MEDRPDAAADEQSPPLLSSLLEDERRRAAGYIYLCGWLMGQMTPEQLQTEARRIRGNGTDRHGAAAAAEIIERHARGLIRAREAQR